MRKLFTALALMAVLAFTSGCTRIATGEVGLRVDMSNQTLPGELLPGSWNQTFWGSVLEFPVRDVPLSIVDAHPLTSDKTPLQDFDLTAAYAINPSCVSDLWTTKSKTFHGMTRNNEWLLMQQFVQNTLNAASWKAVADYKALEISDKREAIQASIHKGVQDELKALKYDTCLTVGSIQVKSIVPDQSILASAKAVVNKANELAAKNAEVQIAEAENRRLEALSKNGQNLDVMRLENERMIAQGIRDGRVNTIVIPAEMKGMVNLPALGKR